MKKFSHIFSRTLALLALVVTFGSCKMIELSSLHPNSVMPHGIPALQLIENKESSAPNTIAYPYAYYAYNTYQDANVLYQRFIEDSLSLPVNATYGYAEFHTVIGQNGYCGWGWYCASIITLGVGNLLGMPFLKSKSNLEVELDVYNSKHLLISKYTATGFSKATVAAYYGYTMGSATRQANIDAVKMALRSIHEQLLKDSNLPSRLLAEGPVK